MSKTAALRRLHVVQIYFRQHFYLKMHRLFFHYVGFVQAPGYINLKDPVCVVRRMGTAPEACDKS